jgi:hypothetical protein
MMRIGAISGRLALLLLTTLITVASPAIAQQDPAATPQTTPTTQPDAPKETKTAPAADGPSQLPADPNERIGKTKLEQETGTVNDRLFAVLPNYTVESSKTLPPLRVSQKFRLATASVFDWAVWPFNGALAAIAQAKNDPESWGQGWGAYAKRYGASFADNSIGTMMTTAIFPSLLHEDPRYYRLGKGSFGHRAYYSMNRLFVTRTDEGKSRYNWSESVGNAAAAAISNVYYPEEERTASRNATTFGYLILYDGLANELKEFWPDIKRKILHKTPAPAPAAP